MLSVKKQHNQHIHDYGIHKQIQGRIQPFSIRPEVAQKESTCRK
jgi:hypothetical protein